MNHKNTRTKRKNEVTCVKEEKNRWTRLVDNIYLLAKEKNLKIGEDLEKPTGASIGYLSRFRGENPPNAPKLEYIAPMADLLGVTIDSLLHTDYAALPKGEKYLLTVLDQLIARTESDDQIWDRQTREDIDAIIRGGLEHLGDGLEPHPLMQTDVTPSKAGTPKWHYLPPTAKYNIAHLLGDIYVTTLNEKNRNHHAARMYLVQSEQGNRLPGKTPGSQSGVCIMLGTPCYDLYLALDGKRKLVCSTVNVKPPLREKLRTLYEAASASTARTHVAEDIKDVLDVFLNGGEEKDPLAGLFSDSAPPAAGKKPAIRRPTIHLKNVTRRNRP